jgi:hypothetical protein
MLVRLSIHGQGSPARSLAVAGRGTSARVRGTVRWRAMLWLKVDLRQRSTAHFEKGVRAAA